MCTQPRHGIHRCTRRDDPDHKIHVCWPCVDNATWNDRGQTFREWVNAGRPKSWETVTT